MKSESSTVHLPAQKDEMKETINGFEKAISLTCLQQKFTIAELWNLQKRQRTYIEMRRRSG